MASFLGTSENGLAGVAVIVILGAAAFVILRRK